MRLYEEEDYNRGEINNYLKILTEIMETNITTYTQLKEFKQRTGRSRATYYRYKKFLTGKTDRVSYCRTYSRKGCYFCTTISYLVIHHLDFNRSNNDIANRVVLCEKCHARLHYILRKYKESLSGIKYHQFSNMRVSYLI